MAEKGGWREWAVAVLVMGVVIGAIVWAMTFKPKSPDLGRGASAPISALTPAPAPAPEPAPPAEPARTIELYEETAPLDANSIEEVRVAVVKVTASGRLSLELCDDPRVAARVEAVLAEMRDAMTLGLAEEQALPNGRGLKEVQVSRADPRYVWAAARRLRLKTDLSYKVLPAVNP